MLQTWHLVHRLKIAWYLYLYHHSACAGAYLNCFALSVLSSAFSTKSAPSSEFVSSSIPSWQILTAHAQPFRGASDLAFCLKVPLDSLLVWASSGGSGETARMRRLAWTFAARIGDKCQIRLTRSNIVCHILFSEATCSNFVHRWNLRRLLWTAVYCFFSTNDYVCLGDMETCIDETGA